jgi:hypothetical protein
MFVVGKRPALLLLALAIRVAPAVSLITAPTITPLMKWDVFSHDLKDLKSSSLIESFSMLDAGDFYCRENGPSCGTCSLAQFDKTKSRNSHGLALNTTSTAVLQNITSKIFENEQEREGEGENGPFQATLDDQKVQEAAPWPTICMDDARRCYLPSQRGIIALFGLGRNQTTDSNVTTHVEREVDAVLRRSVEVEIVDPVQEFQRKSTWTFFVSVEHVV